MEIFIVDEEFKVPDFGLPRCAALRDLVDFVSAQKVVCPFRGKGPKDQFRVIIDAAGTDKPATVISLRKNSAEPCEPHELEFRVNDSGSGRPLAKMDELLSSKWCEDFAHVPLTVCLVRADGSFQAYKSDLKFRVRIDLFPRDQGLVWDTGPIGGKKAVVRKKRKPVDAPASEHAEAKQKPKKTPKKPALETAGGGHFVTTPASVRKAAAPAQSDKKASDGDQCAGDGGKGGGGEGGPRTMTTLADTAVAAAKAAVASIAALEACLEEMALAYPQEPKEVDTSQVTAECAQAASDFFTQKQRFPTQQEGEAILAQIKRAHLKDHRIGNLTREQLEEVCQAVRASKAGPERVEDIAKRFCV